MVHLSGSLYHPSGIAPEAFAVLPPDARPAADQVIDVYSYNGAVASLIVNTDGTIGVMWGNPTLFTSLAGVTYLAASSAETPLGLVDGWQAVPTWSNVPSYYISNGVVHLDGAVLNTGSGKVAVLPPDARPTHALYFSVSISSDEYPAILLIEPDGSMYTFGGPSSAYTSADYTAFCGISYEAGS